ncbi:hypothetical protein [Paenibacillus sp. NRS-1760]|uniref:hypothetical protein n=1 Tax=Paenibacillus sp. NRS-1760 TaxID=3233902 RepID=UPI003D2C4C16
MEALTTFIESEKAVINPNNAQLRAATYCAGEKTVTGYGSNNNAISTTKADSCVWSTVGFPFSVEHRSVEAGSQTGKWLGCTPQCTPNKMIFHQTTTFDGVLVTVGWPPFFVHTGTTGTWTSAEVTNSYNFIVDRPYIEAKTSWLTAGAIFSVEVKDQVDVYVNGAIYKPQSIINF